MGKTKRTIPITSATVSLVVTNLIPVYGVLFLGWLVFPVVFLYWLENGIIGVSTIAKLLSCRGPSKPKTPPRLFLAAFFTVHYGIFWAVHGVFVFVLFGGSDLARFGGGPGGPQQVGDLLTGGWVAAAAALAISHGLSFVRNFIGRGERDRAEPKQLLFQPYKRVVLLHVGIIGSGFVVALLGSPAYALVLFILAKTALDLHAHTREHRTAQGRTGDQPAHPRGRTSLSSSQLLNASPRSVVGRAEAG